MLPLSSNDLPSSRTRSHSHSSSPSSSTRSAPAARSSQPRPHYRGLGTRPVLSVVGSGRAASQPTAAEEERGEGENSRVAQSDDGMNTTGAQAAAKKDDGRTAPTAKRKRKEKEPSFFIDLPFSPAKAKKRLANKPRGAHRSTASEAPAVASPTPPSLPAAPPDLLTASASTLANLPRPFIDFSAPPLPSSASSDVFPMSGRAGKGKSRKKQSEVRSPHSFSFSSCRV